MRLTRISDKSRDEAALSVASRPDVAARAAERRGLLAACAGAFVVALALRLYRLGAQSLWLDEGGTWTEISRKSWPALIGELFSKDAAYPLYHLLLKGWAGLAGDSEWALRFPSALAGAAAAVAVLLAARELRRPKDEIAPSSFVPRPSSLAPLAAVALFACSPFALWYAQDAKVYSLLMLAVALDLWAILRAIRRGTGRAWLLALGIALASIFVHRLALLSAAAAALTYVLVWPAGYEAGGWGPQAPEKPSFPPVVRRLRLRTAGEGKTVRGDAPHTPSKIREDGERGGRAHGAAQAALRAGWAGVALATMAAGIAGTIIAVRGESQGSTGHVVAGPLQGLWLSFVHFGVDRGDLAGFLGIPLIAWLLPYVALTLCGLAALLRDVRRAEARAVLCMLVVPLALFACALAFAQVYEARYATIAFPAWILTMAYPFAAPRAEQQIQRAGDFSPPGLQDSKESGLGSPFALRPSPSSFVLRPSSFALRPSSLLVGLLCAALAVDALALLQPEHGLFSGAPVKEQWRDAIGELARRAHPDDLIVLHPYYAQPMWDYYAPRVTPDSLPQPVSFLNFREGYLASLPPSLRKQRAQREYEPAYNAAARGKRRALLLIAPDHARTIDPPDEALGDKYGWVGLRFQYSADQRTWPCGGAAFVGVELMCQSYPEAFQTGAIPQPATPLDATFGGQLRLRGYSLDPAGGQARPGGALPVTLYWEAAAPPTSDYRMFLHLCHDCAAPPLANDDGPPLNGYGDAGRTTTWRIADPLHDERSLCLPHDLAPGSYTLLLGVYPSGDPSDAARLPVVSAAPVLGGTRLVLGQATIAPASGGPALRCGP